VRKFPKAIKPGSKVIIPSISDEQLEVNKLSPDRYYLYVCGRIEGYRFDEVALLPTPLAPYKVEFTDTMNGEANYSWTQRFIVLATTMTDAITKAKRKRYNGVVCRHIRSDLEGSGGRCWSARIDIPGANTCAFIDSISTEEMDRLRHEEQWELV
jgi:hypothetical protein